MSLLKLESRSFNSFNIKKSLLSFSKYSYPSQRQCLHFTNTSNLNGQYQDHMTNNSSPFPSPLHHHHHNHRNTYQKNTNHFKHSHISPLWNSFLNKRILNPSSSFSTYSNSIFTIRKTMTTTRRFSSTPFTSNAAAMATMTSNSMTHIRTTTSNLSPPISTSTPSPSSSDVSSHQTITSLSNTDHMHEFKDSFICDPSESMIHIQWIQDFFIYMHDVCHLPWWGVIITGTFILRTLFLPINLSLIRNSARLNNIRPDLEIKNQQLREYQNIGDLKNATRIAGEIVDLFDKNKCSPVKNLISPLLMTPIFLSVFMAWERIVVFTPSCASGGIAWFENLQVPDISFLLPVLSALTWIGTFKIGADRVRTKQAAEFESLCSYLSLAMIPVTQILPQGIFLYWLSSNIYSLILMMITRNARVRQLLKIPIKRITPGKYEL